MIDLGGGGDVDIDIDDELVIAATVGGCGGCFICWLAVRMSIDRLKIREVKFLAEMVRIRAESWVGENYPQQICTEKLV